MLPRRTGPGPPFLRSRWREGRPNTRMHRRILLLFCTATLAALGTGCQSMNYAQRGALAGGLAGAGIGTAVGESGGDAVPGALIGGAIGALTGGVIGDGMDADRARQAQIEAAIGRQMAGAVTADDAIAMTRAGLSDAVITAHIRANGVARPPEVNDLITLRNQGVSDAVITALQTTRGPVAVVRAAPPPPPPMIVEAVHYDPWCPPPPWYHRHHHHRHRPGVTWGIHLH
jgi:hypothetical protein